MTSVCLHLRIIQSLNCLTWIKYTTKSHYLFSPVCHVTQSKKLSKWNSLITGCFPPSIPKCNSQTYEPKTELHRCLEQSLEQLKSKDSLPCNNWLTDSKLWPHLNIIPDPSLFRLCNQWSLYCATQTTTIKNLCRTSVSNFLFIDSACSFWITARTYLQHLIQNPYFPIKFSIISTKF